MYVKLWDLVILTIKWEDLLKTRIYSLVDVNLFNFWMINYLRHLMHIRSTGVDANAWLHCIYLNLQNGIQNSGSVYTPLQYPPVHGFVLPSLFVNYSPKILNGKLNSRSNLFVDLCVIFLTVHRYKVSSCPLSCP